MIYLDRFVGNPILEPNQINPWEAEAAFNGSIIKEGNKFFLLYRAQSKLTIIDNKKLEVSTIGCTESIDRIHFENRKQFIKNEQTWEKFGCEDPRITKIGNKFYIFYTALSNNPPKSQGIKVAVAISSDMQVISEKHLVTPFNAKAMALFPEKINDKFVAILTVNTDMPPAKIALVYFDDESQIWDHNFWNNWYKNLDQHALPLLRNQYDHLEVGAVPLKTIFGWLLIYCYIKNYQSSNKTFGIEAVLLDLNNPAKILGRSENPLLVPEKKYELFGKVPNVIFPSGSLIYNQTLGVYYGAADTTCCLAACDLNQLLEDLLHQHVAVTFDRDHLSFRRYSKNPIINPILEHEWENKYTLNPAAVYLDNKVHLLYRAMGKHNTSVLGYASSQNGVHIDERLSYPVYLPREDFERKLEPGNSGCEDPRLTVFGNTLYMCYTAYDSKNPTRVALTSISTSNFCNKNWQWSRPILISPPGMNDKNACLLPEKISKTVLECRRRRTGLGRHCRRHCLNRQNCLYVFPR